MRKAPKRPVESGPLPWPMASSVHLRPAVTIRPEQKVSREVQAPQLRGARKWPPAPPEPETIPTQASAEDMQLGQILDEMSTEDMLDEIMNDIATAGVTEEESASLTSVEPREEQRESTEIVSTGNDVESKQSPTNNDEQMFLKPEEKSSSTDLNAGNDEDLTPSCDSGTNGGPVPVSQNSSLAPMGAELVPPDTTESSSLIPAESSSATVRSVALVDEEKVPKHLPPLLTQRCVLQRHYQRVISAWEAKTLPLTTDCLRLPILSLLDPTVIDAWEKTLQGKGYSISRSPPFLVVRRNP